MVSERNPSGWTCTDPEKAAWLDSMNHLTSSVPAIAPIVRMWLRDECELVEGHGADL
jgi:hypothetical protein